MIDDRVIRTCSLSHAIAACAVASTLLFILPAAPNVIAGPTEDRLSPAADGDSPTVTSLDITPGQLERNRITLVAIKFGFEDTGRNLRGGMANINFVYSNGKSRFVTYELSHKKFRRKRGNYTIYTSLPAEGWDWVDIDIWLRDGDGNNGTNQSEARLAVDTEEPEETQGRKRGRRAYNFSLYDQRGNLVSLYDYLGSVVLIDLCTMWCGPCQREAAQLEQLYQTYGAQGLVVLTAVFQNTNGNPPTQEDCLQWANTYGTTFPTMADVFEGVYGAFTGRTFRSTKKFPYNVIVDRNMIIRYGAYGYTQKKHNRMESLIQTLLAES